jgi:hypothetical protein
VISAHANVGRHQFDKTAPKQAGADGDCAQSRARDAPSAIRTAVTRERAALRVNSSV